MTSEHWTTIIAAIAGLIGAVTIYVKARAGNGKTEAPTGILEFRLAPKEMELANRFVQGLDQIGQIVPELKRSADAQEKLVARREQQLMDEIADLKAMVSKPSPRSRSR